MNRLLHTIFACFLALTLVVIFMVNCAAPNAAEMANERNQDFSAKPPPLKQSDPHSRLLPTLKVTRDPCYVFVQPKQSSPYFGPLVKGEKVKWLDNQGDWVQVWIPRLRVSGWVHETKMSETAEALSGPVNVPVNLLSTVTVLTARANIRAAPTTRAQIIQTARKDQRFWLLNAKGGWCQVWLAELGKKGWIHGKLVIREQKN